MTSEPFPGVEIVHDDDGDGGVYISDVHGEIVMWLYEEIVEDPDAWTASLRAVGLAARGEFAEIRKLIGREIPVLDRLAKET